MTSKKQKIADKDRYSILVPDFKRCYVCGCTSRICIHEVFYGTASRQKSIEDGMCLPLCFEHHQGTTGVHFNKDLDEKIKKQAEKLWIKEYCDEEMSSDDKIESFIRRYGRNYLDDEDV